jgi:hypothetical protein
MSSTTFENAEVGDRVESLVWGAGKVWAVLINPNLLQVVYESVPPRLVDYTLHGVEVNGLKGAYVGSPPPGVRTLFWPGSVVITPQEQPQRKVKKTMEGWVAVSKRGDVVTPVYAECADLSTHNAGGYTIAPAVLTYEVEE